MPVDVLFQHVLPSDTVVDHQEFVARLKHDLSEAARIAQQNSHVEQTRQAKNYNRRAKGSPLTVGTEFCLQTVVREEKGKLQTNGNPQCLK